MAKNSPSLKLIPGNKRSVERVKKYVEPPVEVNFFGFRKTRGTIKESGYNNISLALPLDANSERLPEFVDILIEADTGPIIDGRWQVIATRIEGAFELIALKHAESKQLDRFKDLISPDLPLLHNRFRIFAIDKDKVDQEEFASHLTEVKDCPTPISCKIKGKSGTDEFKFDFSSNLKNLSGLTFSVSSSEKLETFDVGEVISAEYHFLGVRYLFHASVAEKDKNFSMLTLDIPDLVFSSTARRFDRFDCKYKVQINQNLLGEIIDISAAGFTVRFHEKKDWPEGEVQVRIEKLKLSFRSLVLRKHDDKLTFLFSNDIESKKAAMHLISRSIGRDMVVREPSNYDKFIALYDEVVDSDTPTDVKKPLDWIELTKKVWAIQDERFPGNLAAVQEYGRVICCLGALPFSPTSVYAHSLRMIKSAHSARAMLNIMIYSHIWAELIPSNLLYAGSFTSAARFTVRMHTYFQAQPKPHRQMLGATNCLPLS